MAAGHGTIIEGEREPGPQQAQAPVLPLAARFSSGAVI